MTAPAAVTGRFDLLICDCDGVLVDSETLICRIDAEELTASGILAITADEVVRRFTGVSQTDMWRIIEAETGRPIPPDFDGRVSERVRAAMLGGLEALPGVHAAIEALPLPRCVASGSRPDKLVHALEVTGLYGLFAPHVFSAVEVDRGKPAPDLFLLAAARMNADPARCCVVEDSIAGVTAGVAAGMTVIGFTGGSHCGAGHAARLRQAGAAAVVGGWGEIGRTISEVR